VKDVAKQGNAILPCQFSHHVLCPPLQMSVKQDLKKGNPLVYCGISYKTQDMTRVSFCSLRIITGVIQNYKSKLKGTIFSGCCLHTMFLIQLESRDDV
jgi:hypothetical protein